MIDQHVLARVHLYGLLRALELLPRVDAASAELIRGRDLTIEFRVPGIGRARLHLRDGCVWFETVGTENQWAIRSRPDVVLGFTSATHLNKTIERNRLPILLRGFRHFAFLHGPFQAYTARLEHFLRPDAKRLTESDYAAAVTRLTSYVAFHALSEVGNHDRFASLSARYIPDGVIQIMEITAEGVGRSAEELLRKVSAKDGTLATGVGEHEDPRCVLWFHDLQTLYELLGGSLNPYDGIALGRLRMKGFIPMMDFLTPVLGRIPVYLL